MGHHQHINIYIMGVPGKEKEKGAEKKNFEEILSKSFPSLIKDMTIHIQESQQTLRRQRNPHHIIINVEGQRISKATRDKQFIIYKAFSRKINGLFLIRKDEGQKTRRHIFKELKGEKNVNQEFCIQQNNASKMKKKLQHSQINKS